MTALVIIACVLVLAASGLKSAALYSGSGVGPRWTHPAQFVVSSLVGALPLLMLWPDGRAAAFFAAVGVTLVGDVLFQGFINRNKRWPFIDRDEAEHAGATWNAGIIDIEIPKFYGWGRYVELALGTASIYMALFPTW